MATPPPPPDMGNRAGESTSPYIRRHAESPVSWQPLTQESLDRAAQENKLVFVNIGSAPCHYAQLMTQETWSRPSVAKILNEHYIPILVDRDERPDLDSIYAHYLMSIHGKVGYPMNLFLTSKLHPVYGDTYLEGPADHEEDEAVAVGEDNPNMLFVLKRVSKHWREERERLLAEGRATFAQLKEILAEGTRTQPPTTTKSAETATATEEAPAGGDAGGGASVAPVCVDIELDNMEEAYAGHAKLYDPVKAGFLSIPPDPSMPGIIPKFSMVSRLDYLLRLSHLPAAVRDVVGEDECATAAKMTLDTLRKIRDSTMHDHLAGGFHSSTQTRDWAFPLFDKVTGHNGQLLDLYLDAWLTVSSAANRKSVISLDQLSFIGQKGDKNEFLDVVISLADYLTSSPICLPSGGFATSEAADSVPMPSTRPRATTNNLKQGAYYVWTKRDFLAALASSPTTPPATSSSSPSSTTVPPTTTAASPPSSNPTTIATIEAETVANLAELTTGVFNIRHDGNIDKVLDPRDEFINENVLSIPMCATQVEMIAFGDGVMPPNLARHMRASIQKLRAWREKGRQRPEVDMRVLAGENGKVISALARAGAVLVACGTEGVLKERGEKYLVTARAAAAVVKEGLWDAGEDADGEEGDKGKGILYRMLDSEGKKVEGMMGFAEDYAFLIEALLGLYEATGEQEWLVWADELMQSQITHFYDPRQGPSTSTSSSTSSLPPFPPTQEDLNLSHCGAFYSSNPRFPSHAPTLMRTKNAMDDVSPSVNGVSAANLFRLSQLLKVERGERGERGEEYRRLGEETIMAFEVEIPVHPGLFTSLLVAVVGARMGGRRWGVVARDGVGGEEGGGDGMDFSTAREVREYFYAAPRGGLRSLVRLESGKDGVEGQGGYVFDEEKGKWARATRGDISS